MISRLKTCIARETDPYRNIALEKYLTLHAAEGECVLFLWQNQRTVVIGRNQNAWEECRVRELTEDGGRLARRLSGGGAVYHDLGNLNFSFAVRKADCDPARQSEVVLRAVKRLGAPAEKTGRNDFAVNGRKFSGNAFYEAGGCRCHHGTIMLEVDTLALERYLTVPPAKLKSKGVPSVRARVMNLKEICPNISVEALRAALIEAFQEVYGLEAEALALDAEAEKEIQNEKKRLSSPAWLFPPRLPFTQEIGGRFPWGGIRIGLCVRQNMIENADCESDALDERLIRAIRDALPGCPYGAEAIADRVLKTAAHCGDASADAALRSQMAAQIAQMVREQMAQEQLEKQNGSGI